MRYYETPSRFEQSVFSNRVSVTFVLIMINVATFVAQLVLLRFAWMELDKILAMTPDEAILQWKPWQFVTYMFVHDYRGGIFHLLINVLMLYMFGRELEWSLGRARFLILYMSCGIYAGLCHGLYGFLADQITVPLIGASGAVYGIMTTYALFWPERTILLFFIVPMKVWHCVLIFIGVDILYALTMPASGVAHFAHLGGALTAFLMYKFSPAMENAAMRWETRSARRKFLSEFEMRKEIDRILDKINVSGIQSLTRKERSLLDRASKKLNRNPSKLDNHE